VLLDVRKAVRKQRLAVEPILIPREEACTPNEESMIRLRIDEAVASSGQHGAVLADVQGACPSAQPDQVLWRELKHEAVPGLTLPG
jgi:hypothetical protein